MSYKFKPQNCNLCGKSDTVFIGNRSPLAFKLNAEDVCRIVKCRQCGLIYPDPVPVPDQEQLQLNYSQPDEYFPEAALAGRLQYYETILKELAEYLPAKAKLLDIGCGRGELVYQAQKRGWQAQGIDTSQSFINYARTNFGLGQAVKLGQIQDINFPDAEFDAVSLVSVLHHTYDPIGLLREISRVLKKGGILFIETMNNDALVYKLGDIYYRLLGSRKTTRLSPTFPSYQVYGFSPYTARLICDLSGFDILKLKILGGRARPKEYSGRPAGEKIVRYFRDLLLIAGKWLNQGQLLFVYAKKR